MGENIEKHRPGESVVLHTNETFLKYKLRNRSDYKEILFGARINETILTYLNDVR